MSFLTEPTYCTMAVSSQPLLTIIPSPPDIHPQTKTVIRKPFGKKKKKQLAFEHSQTGEEGGGEGQVKDRQYPNSRSPQLPTLTCSLPQVEAYPFSSFLAEFGGALSLFTGFSFMMLHEGLENFFHRFWATSK